MGSFHEFMDRKEREAKKHLKIIGKVLEQGGMKVSNHLDADDPYLFIHVPDLSFEGLRLYQIGSQMAFRIQKQEDTHPYGTAYGVNVEDIFDDMMGDHKDPEKAGRLVAKAILEEIGRFVTKSGAAEKDMRAGNISTAGDPMDKMVVQSTGTDYSNLVNTKG